ncbi:MAG: RlmE family RNA methyltransferase, partial [Thermodesulfobacteria bacterium]|nr:RlmE family RNA methyltransferase [Thermodesulfobacteriota bacterium]
MKEIKDHYFYKAKKEGYPARSVYKLIEAQNKFKFLKPGQRILDLGAAPGSWTKYAAKVVGPKGVVVAVDLHRLKVNMPNVFFIKDDIYEVQTDEAFKQYIPFDVILSDMAPKTTGRKDLDHYRSVDLARMALDIASRHLTENGSAYFKVFDGEDFPQLKREAQELFKSVKIFKPKSSRAESVEK